MLRSRCEQERSISSLAAVHVDVVFLKHLDEFSRQPRLARVNFAILRPIVLSTRAMQSTSTAGPAAADALSIDQAWMESESLCAQ